MKKIVKSFIPPILFHAWEYLFKILNPRQQIDATIPIFEYIPNGWEFAKTHSEVKGWNVADILKVYEKKWPTYVSKVQGTGPLCFSPESELNNPADISHHNSMMVFAYVLSLSAQGKDSISVLDWGGAIGHYYILAKSLLPNIIIDYHCKDVPLFVEYGKTLLPETHFYLDETCFNRVYDLVFASGSLQYSSDWEGDFDRLAESTSKYMLITRLPIIKKNRSFVFIQRAHSYGYNTAYLAWCINKNELLERAKAKNLQLLREFIIGDDHHISDAPEQARYYGFLLRKNNAVI